jgi:hypothetical protein
MKVQTQATGLSTAQFGDKFDFWKQIKMKISISGS